MDPERNGSTPGLTTGVSETVPPAVKTSQESRTSSFVVAGRLILLLLAGIAVVSAFALSHSRDRSASVSGERYVCPMHPEVVSAEPSQCPICRMALEQVRPPPPLPSSGAVDHYVCPMHPEVVSPTPDRCPACRMALEPVTAAPPAAPGSATNAPSSSDAAYLAAPFSVPQSTRQQHRVIGAAKRRVIALEVRAPAWLETDGVVTAVLYKDELEGLVPDEHGLFFGASAPGSGVDVRLTADPPASWDASTSRVHFRIAPGAPVVPPGEVGWVKLAPKSREPLVVPSSAILYSPDGPYVLGADAEGRTFQKRHVELGKVFTKQNLAVVLSGLNDGDRVAVGGTFFLDAERRLQAQREEAAGATK